MHCLQEASELANLSGYGVIYCSWRFADFPKGRKYSQNSEGASFIMSACETDSPYIFIRYRVG